MYWEYFDWFPFVFIGGIIIAIIMVIVGASALSGHIETINCNNVAKQGFITKLEPVILFDKTCFIATDTGFIPYNKWIVNTGN